eukprot:Skav228615  [mRNA]  locus=scaffold2037:69330:75719:+ [translate_table: standard]
MNFHPWLNARPAAVSPFVAPVSQFQFLIFSLGMVLASLIQSSFLAILALAFVVASDQVDLEFARCHEVKTQRFLKEDAGDAAAPCLPSAQLQSAWASYVSFLDSANTSDTQSLQQVSRSYQEMCHAIEATDGPLQTDDIAPWNGLAGGSQCSGPSNH